MARRLTVCILLLLAPLAAAEGGERVEGEIRLASDLHVAGAARFSSAEAALDLTGAVRASEALGLRWEGAHGYLVTREWRIVDAGAEDPESAQDEDHDNRSVDLPAGALRAVWCGPECMVLLLATPEGLLGVEGEAWGRLDWLAEEKRYYADWSNGHVDSFARVFPSGSLVASPDSLGGARPFAEGNVLLVVKDALVEVETPHGRTARLDARIARSSTVDAPGLQVETVVSRFAVVTLRGASLDAPAGGASVFLAQSPRVDLEGRLEAARASGRVAFGGATRTFEDERFLAEGSLTLLPALRETALLSRPLPAARFEGEATMVVVGGATMRAPEAAQPPVETAAATGLGALLAAAWLLERHGFAALYSRISRSRVLANPNRAAMYEAICATPGLTAADLRRRMGLARVVVRHHLRFLEAHQYVARRRDGRRQRFFPAGALQDEGSVATHVLLKEESRRKLADALAVSPVALSQRELAARTGLSERLVSHHLARLEEAGLVSSRGLRPRRYAFAQKPQ